MGTKNNPGQFDCYANADPDEPMFVLLGRDPMAGMLVRLWVLLRRRAGEDLEKCAEALECAGAMDGWTKECGKDPYNETFTMLDEMRKLASEIDGFEAAFAACFGRTATHSAVDVIRERQRQIESEGWTPEHDDEHHWGELAAAARCYALGMSQISGLGSAPPAEWPWDPEWWKPGNYRENLIKSAALLVAEIDRMDRTRVVGGST